ncbi:flavodoxin family protein [Novosphingobium piscinae]|uniref:flavodoxin family protein n=1 Tax=Novosphingobium piscinae TaxID=1507448 RepID=UPI001FE462B3|nr:NAD(P)H-dependent oxidoreductase [Novosphingobium piscinae]
MSHPSLLIVWHSRTGAAAALARAAADGAGPAARLIEAGACQADDLLAAQGFLFVAPENLGSLSGAMKELFDRCYYPLLGRVEGRGYATIIAAGSDGSGAQRQLDRIVTGWRLRRIAPPQIALVGAQTAAEILAPKAVTSSQLQAARELGEAMAHGLALGVF